MYLAASRGGGLTHTWRVVELDLGRAPLLVCLGGYAASMCRLARIHPPTHGHQPLSALWEPLPEMTQD